VQILPNHQPTDRAGEPERALGVGWVTVVLGCMLLVGNVLELGGVEGAAQEWTAWLMAGILLVYGISLGLEEAAATGGLPIPRLPLAALPFVAWLAYSWWRDTATPWTSQETFFLVAQAWLLGWVVAATPGDRSLSWAWLIVVAMAAALAFVAAVAWQHGSSSLWLPLERELPAEWMGRWSGTLPTPGAFGGLLILGGAPLLVLGLSRRLPYLWRVLLGYVGVALVTGAVAAYSLGAWLGAVVVMIGLPWVLGSTRQERRFGLAAVAALLTVTALAGLYLWRSDPGGPSRWFLLQAGEPSTSDTWLTLRYALQVDPWDGGNGMPFADLSRAAGAIGRGNGWAYGFSDWVDLLATRGLFGLGLGAAGFGVILAAGWRSWSKLPFWIAKADDESSPNPEGPAMHEHAATPETKVLLGAATLGLTGFAAVMLATRTLNVPAVVYAFAVVAGVVARNVPQRGGSLRLPVLTRWLVGLSLSLVVAGVMVLVVAPAARAQVKLDQAVKRLDQGTAVLRRNLNLLREAEEELHAALASDNSCAPAWTELARLELEKSTLEPVQFEAYSQQAIEASRRALVLAPNAPAVLVMLALANLLDNHVGEATRHLRQALVLAPRDLTVQYYAVAILALDPANRPEAERMVESVRGGPYARGHLLRLEEALKWAKASTVPLHGMHQRPLPPPFQPPPVWPPLNGLPEGTRQAAVRANAARQAAKTASPVAPKPAPAALNVVPGRTPALPR